MLSKLRPNYIYMQISTNNEYNTLTTTHTHIYARIGGSYKYFKLAVVYLKKSTQWFDTEAELVLNLKF